eukprot:CAMPEP_0172623894 /NCGR_PEP_ID=MMETSP1068-20121228/132228_1 /TAXON_ID=35684 /ORGANISM="Pseudopedinella elastica, Strain CCMP716" /LENGTH=91 /DNA_ID=CAMNT_0013432627 /DNA_START=1 /DNA_END=272 /DNA_ORIENTATION=-
MKFGKDLATSMVSEWAPHYCKYNELKAMLKDISAEPGKAGSDHTPFFLMVEEELQKVNQFYLQTLNETEANLQQVSTESSGLTADDATPPA